ncbi:MAG: thioesterase family protein [Chloroflexota bacterium]
MSLPQPEGLLELRTDVVQPEWLDYNNHMNEGYYGVAFGHVTDAFMDYIGLHETYRTRTRCTIYTVETHIHFLRELKESSPLRFTTQLLGYDAKRFHLIHMMYHAEEGYLAATMEAMMLHVNDEPRTIEMPPEIMANLDAIDATHSTIPHPRQAGKSIGMKKRK